MNLQAMNVEAQQLCLALAHRSRKRSTVCPGYQEELPKYPVIYPLLKKHQLQELGAQSDKLGRAD